MKMMNLKHRFTNSLVALFLLLALLLSACGSPGNYKGKYSRDETMGAVTMTRYFLVYESCIEQDGKKTCQQYEQEVDADAYNSH